jgi:hypothetical protein
VDRAFPDHACRPPQYVSSHRRPTVLDYSQSTVERERALGRAGSTDGTLAVADIDDRVINYLAEMLVLAAGVGEHDVATLPRGWDWDRPSILGAYEATLHAIHEAYPDIKARTYNTLMSGTSDTKLLYVPAWTPQFAGLTWIFQDFGCDCIHHGGAEHPS